MESKINKGEDLQFMVSGDRIIWPLISLILIARIRQSFRHGGAEGCATEELEQSAEVQLWPLRRVAEWDAIYASEGEESVFVAV